MRRFFPTRQNVLPNSVAGRERGMGAAAHALALEGIEGEGSETPMLISAVQGVDETPQVMSPEEIAALGDVFTAKILLAGQYPLSLGQLVDAIDGISDEDKLPLRRMFLVAEGGQLKPSNPAFDLNARLAFTWQRDSSSPPDLLVSTLPIKDDEQALLQLIAWSDLDGSFHFFERKRGVWGWAGNSFHALEEPSRGKGPFDSHVNGGLVMKELKAPWGHWQSQSATIPNEAFESDSEFLNDPLFAVVTGAEDLEKIVKTGVRRWTKSRISKDRGADRSLERVETYMRQALTPTSANLVSSTIEFNRVRTETIKLPTSFFFDVDGIEQAVLGIDPFASVVPGGKIELPGDLYADAVRKVQMRVVSESGAASVPGDTHFCFLVPERAMEDTQVVQQLMESNIASPRFILSLLMVDFVNPVRSDRRASLLQHAPSQVGAGESLETLFVDDVRGAATGADSPEGEFLTFYDSGDLLALVKSELFSFFDGIQSKVGDLEGIVLLLKLAEFRKNLFRQRLLNEFRSTTSQLGQALGGAVTIDQSGTIRETP